jgi:hypothetical protein
MAMRLDHGTDELEEVHGINVKPFKNPTNPHDFVQSMFMPFGLLS